MSSSGGFSRRRFVDLLLAGEVLGLLGLVLYPIIRFLWPSAAAEQVPDFVLVGPVQQFAVGASRIIRFGTKPVIVLRDPEGKFLAFSATCTHLNCTVQFRSEAKLLWCACHDGQYDLSGRNVGGPPPRPLDPYKVEVRGADLYVLKA